MKLKTRVTEEHILEGCRNSDTHCPIALALRSCIPNGMCYRVGCGVLILYKWSMRLPRKLVVDLPYEAVDFIAKFDAEEEVQPFDLEIDLGDDFEWEQIA